MICKTQYDKDVYSLQIDIEIQRNTNYQQQETIIIPRPEGARREAFTGSL